MGFFMLGGCAVFELFLLVLLSFDKRSTGLFRRVEAEGVLFAGIRNSHGLALLLD